MQESGILLYSLVWHYVHRIEIIAKQNNSLRSMNEKVSKRKKERERGRAREKIKLKTLFGVFIVYK